MPRRKKEMNLTLEEQLVMMDAEINKQTEALKALKVKRKDIQEKIASKEKEDVYREFLNSGKTFEDFKILLQSSIVDGNSSDTENM